MPSLRAIFGVNFKTQQVVNVNNNLNGGRRLHRLLRTGRDKKSLLKKRIIVKKKDNNTTEHASTGSIYRNGLHNRYRYTLHTCFFLSHSCMDMEIRKQYTGSG